MRHRTVLRWRACLAMVSIGLVGAACGAEAGVGGWRALADDIRRSTGVAAGLCVQLGCGDGELTAELARGGTLLVHGLSPDRAAAARARQHLARLGIYGQASVEQAMLARLPYADNLANLVVADDLPRLMAAGLSIQEVLRVLRPNGVAWLGESMGTTKSGSPLAEAGLRRLAAAAGIETSELVKRHGLWAIVRKPRPAAMDDWTHRTYDASGNCVSHDRAIGPLHTLRWLAGPVWPLGTYYQVSNGGTVAAGGRVFHVTLNEVSNFKRTPQQRNDTWFLTARDAHNGLLLWSRPIGRKMVRDGQEFGDFVVATQQRVYALLGQDLVALDPATGTTVQVVGKGVAAGGRLVHHQDMLVLAAGKQVRALEPATAGVRWAHQAQAQDLLAQDGRVFYTSRGHAELVCLDLATGRERWRVGLSSFGGRKKQLLFAKAGIVVFVWERNWQNGHNGMAAFAAADGRRLWSFEYQSSRATWCNAVWFVDGLVWHRKGKVGLVGVDPATGEAKRQIALKGGYCGGCTRDIATERYLVSTRPPNFFDWKDGSVHAFRAGRHGCRTGVVVANGMLYSQPHGCKCVKEALRGFLAFAPASQARQGAGPRLERGPAADAGLSTPSAAGRDEWRTFRHDARRTGGTTARVPARLTLAWQVGVNDQRMPPSTLADEWLANPLGGDRLTAPTVADGMVFVAMPDAHRVVALDAGTGQRRWSYTVGGRVDVPPTVYRGLCLIGCYDGWVYCLRAKDGELVWRLRAAPGDQRIVAYGQVESSWPVVGGVLVEKGVAYGVAGRSSAADGGLHGYALDPATGRTVWAKPVRAASSDLLVSEAGGLRIGGGASAGSRLDARTGRPLRGGLSPGFRWHYSGKIATLWGGPNRVLDRTWRVLSVGDRASHWMRIKQGYGPHEGKLLVASPDLGTVYGYRSRYVHWSKEKDPSTEFGGELLAWHGGKVAWKVDVPKTFQVEAMLLAGDALFAAGPTDRFRRTPGGKLWALSANDGQLLREYPLEDPPAADGIAAAGGKLYLTTHQGRVLCLAGN